MTRLQIFSGAGYLRYDSTKERINNSEPDVALRSLFDAGLILAYSHDSAGDSTVQCVLRVNTDREEQVFIQSQLTEQDDLVAIERLTKQAVEKKGWTIADKESGTKQIYFTELGSTTADGIEDKSPIIDETVIDRALGADESLDFHARDNETALRLFRWLTRSLQNGPASFSVAIATQGRTDEIDHDIVIRPFASDAPVVPTEATGKILESYYTQHHVSNIASAVEVAANEARDIDTELSRQVADILSGSGTRDMGLVVESDHEPYPIRRLLSVGIGSGALGCGLILVTEGPPLLTQWLSNEIIGQTAEIPPVGTPVFDKGVINAPSWLVGSIAGILTIGLIVFATVMITGQQPSRSPIQLETEVEKNKQKPSIDAALVNHHVKALAETNTHLKRYLTDALSEYEVTIRSRWEHRLRQLFVLGMAAILGAIVGVSLGFALIGILNIFVNRWITFTMVLFVVTLSLITIVSLQRLYYLRSPIWSTSRKVPMSLWDGFRKTLGRSRPDGTDDNTDSEISDKTK